MEMMTPAAEELLNHVQMGSGKSDLQQFRAEGGILSGSQPIEVTRSLRAVSTSSSPIVNVEIVCILLSKVQSWSLSHNNVVTDKNPSKM